MYTVVWINQSGTLQEFSFYSPSSALIAATDILKAGWTLLSLEQ